MLLSFVSVAQAPPILWAEVEPMWAHSNDLPDEFFSALHEMCGRLDCRAEEMASCWMSESGMSPTAHNPAGATGLFQVIPSTLRGLGFTGDWKAFQALSAVQQLVWAERYYGHHKGRLVSPAACYLSTFMPGLMDHAAEATFVICGRHGPYAYAYAGNYGAFDPTGKGYITVQDLADRIAHVTKGDRWTEIAARIRLAAQGADSSPDGMPNVATVVGQQACLNRLGYPCEVDGLYGSQTRAAVVGFQGDHELRCDGVCGRLTQAALALAIRAAG